MDKLEFDNTHVAVLNTNQDIYDSFNDFMFSEDTRVFGKLVARVLLAEKTKNVPGDIVECGVFKGSGMLTWLKIKKNLFPNSMKKVIGFDYFDTESLISSLSGKDKERMEELFITRNYSHNELGTGAERYISDSILQSGFTNADFELVKGDLSNTSLNFVEERPGFKISILYLDVDLNIPTYDALCNFWPRISKGGVVVFDEYAYHQWSESLGADRFFDSREEQIEILNFNGPTAFVIKK